MRKINQIFYSIRVMTFFADGKIFLLSGWKSLVKNKIVQCWKRSLPFLFRHRNARRYQPESTALQRTIFIALFNGHYYSFSLLLPRRDSAKRCRIDNSGWWMEKNRDRPTNVPDWESVDGANTVASRGFYFYFQKIQSSKGRKGKDHVKQDQIEIRLYQKDISVKLCFFSFSFFFFWIILHLGYNFYPWKWEKFVRYWYNYHIDYNILR